MNPIGIVPDTSLSSESVYTLSDDEGFIHNDSDIECMYCSAALSTETEMINQVCLACMAENDREQKLASFDELVAACRSIIQVAPIVACDIRPTHARTWGITIERIRHVLGQVQWF